MTKHNRKSLNLKMLQAEHIETLAAIRRRMAEVKTADFPTAELIESLALAEEAVVNDIYHVNMKIKRLSMKAAAQRR